MGLRILIVDDSDVTRRILSTIVRSRHWTVCGEAENGWSGIKKFQELRPDVVLLDLAMPDINGIACHCFERRMLEPFEQYRNGDRPVPTTDAVTSIR